jgi:limonene 1,2-monooxygenase
MVSRQLGLGAFMSPLHPVREDPTLLLRRDLELIELLDDLDYEECWVGEHHSAGWGTIGAPEVVIATAAERTRHIKLASGVISLPYHHPFHVASRAVHLDHLTRGRFILGVGAGSIPADAYMLGVDPSETRQVTAEALPAVLGLLNGERVSKKTEWFILQDAALQLGPYSKDGIEVAISSAATATSMKLAGQYGLSTLSFGAPRPGTRPVDLRRQWEYAEESAAEHGQSISRDNWRVTLGIHVAETREEAYADVRAGFDSWVYDYWGGAIGLDVSIPGVQREHALEANIELGNCIVGSVDDCVEGLRRVYDETGGFGRFLAFVHDWASWEKTKRSFDLLARYVGPHFSGSMQPLKDAETWIRDNHHLFTTHRSAMAQGAHPHEVQKA